ncbi:MAG TPA: site-specific integrase [Candidatus Blautia merdipullorum]|nr:site-specific integrase [Candidatus Blautia merdipullorum]
MNPTCFARYMSKYLTEYLPGIQGVSYNTIASKRDAYILLLKYLDDTQNIKAEDVDIPLLSRETIIKYLEWLEKSRGSSVSTRNIRLAAIKSLFSYIQTQTPDYIYQCQQILSIPRKKEPGHTLEYLTVEGIKSVLNAVETSSRTGFRDLTLLSLMYDSAARVQEIADLSVNDFRAEKPSTLRLTGKGSKTRIVPLMSTTSDLVSKYISIYHPSYRGEYNVPLFSNRKKEKLTRAGIAYILKKYVKIAREKQPDLIPETVSPHGLRHSKSMHMLQAGVPLIYIRDFLGHSEISTTEIYARCDSEQKRKAIENTCPSITKSETPMWQKDTSLLGWLQSL